MKLIELTRDIFHVMFPTQLELTSTLLRFQEHFEGQEFKGKIFTLEEYKEWYVANSVMGKKTGMFTYYEDWSGFNFPSDTLGPFYDGKFDPLSDAESHFLNLFRGKRGKKFYIIGTHSETDTPVEDFRHECAHALFFLNESYKMRAIGILLRVPEGIRADINRYLHKSTYCPSVWLDEAHAHILADLEELDVEGIDIEPLRPFHYQLNVLFNEFMSTN